MLKLQQTQLKTECHQSPKLRTFILFKDFFSTATFLKKPLSFIQRKYLAKIRLGCLELEIETGRYSRPIIPAEERLCQVCENGQGNVEDEFHFIMECDRYTYERAGWLNSLTVAPNLQESDKETILKTVLNEPENIKSTAQFLINCFDIRSKFMGNHKRQ